MARFEVLHEYSSSGPLLTVGDRRTARLGSCFVDNGVCRQNFPRCRFRRPIQNWTHPENLSISRQANGCSHKPRAVWMCVKANVPCAGTDFLHCAGKHVRKLVSAVHRGHTSQTVFKRLGKDFNSVVDLWKHYRAATIAPKNGSAFKTLRLVVCVSSAMIDLQLISFG